MTSIRWVLLAATCGMVLAAANCSDETPVFPEGTDFCRYLPTAVGNEWVYKVSVESKYDPPDQYTLTYKITTTKKNYNGYATAYVITITKDGSPYGEITAVPDADAAYVERAMWSYVIADGMKLGGWSQSGLVYTGPMTYARDEAITVPAGDFPACRALVFDNADQFRPEIWTEDYAEDVGLVSYYDNYKEYESSPPYGLLDWRTVTYQLESYDVAPPP